MGPSWCLPSFSCAAASERPQSFSLSPALTAQLWGAEGGGTEGHCDRHKCIHAASSSLKMDFFQPPFLLPPPPVKTSCALCLLHSGFHGAVVAGGFSGRFTKGEEAQLAALFGWGRSAGLGRRKAASRGRRGLTAGGRRLSGAMRGRWKGCVCVTGSVSYPRVAPAGVTLWGGR